MAWTDAKPNVWDRINGILARIRTKSVQGTTHLDAQGVEVAGLNGRFVYLKWDDRVLTWEAYENDGATILKGRAGVDSAWEAKLERIMRDVLLSVEARTAADEKDIIHEAVRDRVARIAHRLEAEEARKWDSLRRGDYIRSRMGEGFVVSWLPSGQVIINMRRGAREGIRVDRTDASAVWNKKTNRWDKLI